MIEIPAAPEPLPGELLARCADLSTRPDVGVVTSPRLRLRPYTASDAAELFTISDGSRVSRLGRHVGPYDHEALVWRYMHAGPFDSAADLADFHDAVNGRPDAQTLTVVDADGGALLGSVSLMANVPAHLRIELGNIWYTPAAQGLGVNREAATALIHALFSLGYQRIEWKCNALNLRSRHAAEALGFTYEGTFDAHMVVKSRRRDTAWYRLLAPDTLPSPVHGPM